MAILPYYIANLNIEYTYREKTGQYVEFPNLVFVDTLDNMDWEGATGGAVTRQGTFELGGLSFDNWYRMQGQNEKTISVILGNPPYNVAQTSFNDFNPNRAYPAIDQRIKDTYVAESTAQKTKQYDMYKRFIRWASDRLADDGIVAFITNRAYLETRQDDGFRKVAAQEFSDIYILDLGSDVRRNPKISGTTHNVFGIQTGVAIGFFVREKAKLGGCGIHYTRRDDDELAVDKLAYLSKALLDDIEFEMVTPDNRNDWLNQSSSDFEQLMHLMNRRTKLAKSTDDERAIFGLYSLGVITARDEWVHDFDVAHLGKKVGTFIGSYEEARAEYGGKQVENDSLSRNIKWTRDLKRQLRLDRPNTFDKASIRRTLYRPFISKFLYFNQSLNEMQYQIPQVFRTGEDGENEVICFLAPSARRPFAALATNKTPSYAMFIDSTQCLPLYRYTEDGERVSNITDWGLRRINAHYRKEFGERFEEVVGGERITAEDVFAYTYAVLHDPVYRHDYRVDLLREFPRLPLYHDWDAWVKMGRELLDLHIGFEDVEPYALERVDKTGSSQSPSSQSPPSQPSPVEGEGAVVGASEGEGVSAPRVMLRANAGDKERGEIHIDSETVLRGVPEFAWEYRLGNRTAIEWVLDQYKEKKPRDPTIRERFNTYRFADYKEDVIDLLRRVCTVSVRTAEIVGGMAYWEGEYLVVSGDRDKREWSMMGLARWFNEPDNPDDDPEYQEWLLSLPDIREQEN